MKNLHINTYKVTYCTCLTYYTYYHIWHVHWLPNNLAAFNDSEESVKTTSYPTWSRKHGLLLLFRLHIPPLRSQDLQQPPARAHFSHAELDMLKVMHAVRGTSKPLFGRADSALVFQELQLIDTYCISSIHVFNGNKLWQHSGHYPLYPITIPNDNKMQYIFDMCIIVCKCSGYMHI